jgi:hypothetical protein
MIIPILLAAIHVSPASLTLRLQERPTGSISAIADSEIFESSSCFSQIPSAHDILRVTSIRIQRPRGGYGMELHVYAQQGGSCYITFKEGKARGGARATTSVRVEADI